MPRRRKPRLWEKELERSLKRDGSKRENRRRRRSIHTTSPLIGGVLVAGGFLPPARTPSRRRTPVIKHAWGTRRYREKNEVLDLVTTKSGSSLGKYIYYSGGNVFHTVNQTQTGEMSPSGQITRTWDQINPGPPYRNGGAFFQVKTRIPSAQVIGPFTASNLGKPGITILNRKEYVGKVRDSGIWGIGGQGDLLSDYFKYKVPSQLPSLSGYHTLAWDRTKPKIPAGNLTQFLIELRDMPRMLESTANTSYNLFQVYRSRGGNYKTEVMSPRNAADSFLNAEFGWRPFLQDYLKIFQTFLDTKKYIERTVRDNGRWMRRRSVLEEKETYTLKWRNYGASHEPGNGNFEYDQLCRDEVVDGITCKGLTDVHVLERERVWAVGSFKYYRPEFDDSLVGFDSPIQFTNRLMTMYGLRVNPTVLYKVTPWTWLIDWFTHFGDFIQHHDEMVNDGIAARYLYLMRSSERYATKTCTSFFYSGSRTVQWQRRLSTKQRILADSPYGFDKPWGGLSPKQLTILGAIGITNGGSRMISRG